MYDWQDGANYATTDNTGNPDHIGIVASVSGNTLKIIEGNISNSVGYRTLQVNGRYIRGWVTPKYASKATGSFAGSGSGASGTTASGSLKVGDTVNFTGNTHYTSANASGGKSCKSGKAKITQIYQLGKSKHPYHVTAVSGGGSNVYGWVDAADVEGVTSGGAQKSVNEIAKEVLNGKWGNGGERKKKLEAAGYNYAQVQAAVNRLCK